MHRRTLFLAICSASYLRCVIPALAESLRVEVLPAPSAEQAAKAAHEQAEYAKVVKDVAKELADAQEAAVNNFVRQACEAAAKAKAEAELARTAARFAADTKAAADCLVAQKCSEAEAAAKRMAIAKIAVKAAKDAVTVLKKRASNQKGKSSAQRKIDAKALADAQKAWNDASQEQYEAEASSARADTECRSGRKAAQQAERKATSTAASSDQAQAAARAADLKCRAAKEIAAKKASKPNVHAPTRSSPGRPAQNPRDTSKRQPSKPPCCQSSWTPTGPDADKMANANADRGDSFAAKQLWGPAESAFREALTWRTNHLRGLLGWANAAAMRDETDVAIRRYSEALEAEPHCAAAYFGRGKSRVHQAQLDAKPGDPLILNAAKRNCQLAIQDLSEAARLDATRDEIARACSDAAALLDYLALLENGHDE